jgi:hypothetical protein
MSGNTLRFDHLAGLLAAAMLLLASAAGAEIDFRAPPKPKAPSKDAEKPADKPSTAGLGQRGEREVGPGDELSFRQSQVAEEMRELEQRMFRLSETLKMLEPENSSRLMLGLKYAREELIWHRMNELRETLAKLGLTGAADEQRQVLVKLERLQQLLLSSDLDFEMKLERLRQIRETLRKLNAVVKEESREEKASKTAAGKEKELAELTNRRAALEALIKQQNEHIETNAALAKQGSLGDDQREAARKLGEAQQSTRKETKALVDKSQIGAASKNLSAAAESMQSAVDALVKATPAEAAPPMDKALDDLKKELDEVLKKEAEANVALPKEQFALMRSDQEGNHRAGDEVTEMTRGLGNNGTAALAELMRAGGFMGRAESAFGNGQAGSGNGEQGRALEALKYAEDLLAQEAERLARQLRREVKKRVADGLAIMLEEQTVVRERTVALQSAVKDGSRQALAAVTALAKREERIAAVAQELINVVEETEFGIGVAVALV